MIKLGHIGIIAEDPQSVANWYKDKLGFQIILEIKKEGRPPIYFLKGEGGSYIEILPLHLKLTVPLLLTILMRLLTSYNQRASPWKMLKKLVWDG